jgi:hypothetical protein
MLDALLVVFHHPAAKRRLVDDLTDVLEHKVVGLQVSICPQAVSLLFGLDDRDLGILLALEPLVLTAIAAVAVTVDAFDFGGAVDAVRVLTAGVVPVVACRWEKSVG